MPLIRDTIRSLAISLGLVLIVVCSAAVAQADVTFTGEVSVGQDFMVTNRISKGSGTFMIDHPLDPKNKLLFHSFVESNEVKNLYDGVAIVDEQGEVRIQLPSYFEALNTDFRYQVKGLDRAMPDVYIKEEVNGNAFVIAGGVPGGELSWQVTGNRHDAFIKAHPLIVEQEKGPGTPVQKGQMLFEGYQKPAFPSPWRLVTRIMARFGAE